MESDQLHVPASFFSEMGRGSTLEPPRRIFICQFASNQTILFSVPVRFSKSERAASEPDEPSSKDVERFPYCFSCLIFKIDPVRLYWNVFAREMHSTTEIRNDVSEQVCVFFSFGCHPVFEFQKTQLVCLLIFLQFDCKSYVLVTSCRSRSDCSATGWLFFN